jgi:hypothetical protein
MPYTFNLVTLSAGTLAPLEKLQATVLDRPGDRSDPLGSGLTDAQARATVSFDLAQFPSKPPGHLPNIFFRILDGHRLVHSTMSAPLESVAPGTYDFDFEIDLKQTVSEFCTATGCITHTEGQPLAGARVRIVDCEMVTDQELGPVDSDAKGVYLHRYSLQQTSPDEVRTADLRISVLDDSGGEIARSAIVRNASGHQVLDLTVPARLVPRRVSEWRWILDRPVEGAWIDLFRRLRAN